MLIHIKSARNKPPLHGHLKIGGKNPEGIEINANNLYITRNGQPWLPVMGEFHYSRYPHEYWEEELQKMKACGIQIISTYVFWIHHEEIEGEFHWDGNLNIRNFIELCKKHELYLMLRAGPWAHGECRNGGLPDWLLKKCKTRTNDPVYLKYVDIYYGEIAAQVKGLLYKDGGPVIGMQLDNELAHGASHLLKLKEMAKNHGIDVPLYTATGWGGRGNADIPEDEMLPLFGGYPEAPWSKLKGELPPSPNYFFHNTRNDSLIGNDLINKNSETGSKDPLQISRYPYLCCELGGGIQVTYHRRPIISPQDVAALTLTKLGCGNNMPGYYVFHGGSNPIGKLYTLQESKETGYPNDYPVISYDFQAPLGEFGQVRESYKEFKYIHMFINDFGSELAQMQLVLPEEKPAGTSDINIPRLAGRFNGSRGFLFFNNYQRSEGLNDFENVQVELKLDEKDIKLPSEGFTLKKDKYFIWPVNFQIWDVTLVYATAQLLCRIDRAEETTYFFFEPDSVQAEYVFEPENIEYIYVTEGLISRKGECTTVSGLKPGLGSIISITGRNNRKSRIITLTNKEALNCWKVNFNDSDSLLISEANFICSKNELKVYGSNNEISFYLYPYTGRKLLYNSQELKPVNEGIFAKYEVDMHRKAVNLGIIPQGAVDNNEFVKYMYMKEGRTASEWKINIPLDALNGLDDLILKINFMGDVIQAFIGGELVCDDFYRDQPFELGLKRFEKDLASNPLVIRISPLEKTEDIYLSGNPKSEGLYEPAIFGIEAVPVYSAVIGT